MGWLWGANEVCTLYPYAVRGLYFLDKSIGINKTQVLILLGDSCSSLLVLFTTSECLEAQFGSHALEFAIIVF